jgi:hypothetical protein
MPACTRCQKAGVSCPGYNPKKPLRWLSPGQIVLGRTQRLPAPARRKTTTPEIALTLYTELEPLQMENYKAVEVNLYCRGPPMPAYVGIETSESQLGLFVGLT